MFISKIKKMNKDVPENLPHDTINEDYYNFQMKIPRQGIKKTLQFFIIMLILILSAPRIVNNIKSIIRTTDEASKEFTVLFPALTKTGSIISNFTYNQLQDLGHFISSNLASVAELFYSRKITPEMITQEEHSYPVRIIIDKVGVDSKIYNPTGTSVEDLEKYLTQGVVRYPKSGLLGEKDNLYLFGHSTSIRVVRNQAYKSLNGINKLENGDIIKVQSKDKEYLYKVVSVKMQKNSEAIIEFNTGKQTLTISTCNTLGEKEDRFIVKANFITSYSLTVNNVDESVTETITKSKTTTSTQNITQNSTKTTAGEVTHQKIKVEIPAQISNPYGKVDLKAEILEVGIIDEESNTFVATSTLSVQNKLAVKFLISNVGTKTAEGWTFNAVLPTTPLYIYHSNNQENLKPGESMEYILAFNQPKKSDEATIIINADPTGSFFEPNEDDNIVKKIVTISE